MPLLKFAIIPSLLAGLLVFILQLLTTIPVVRYAENAEQQMQQLANETIQPVVGGAGGVQHIHADGSVHLHDEPGKIQADEHNKHAHPPKNPDVSEHTAQPNLQAHNDGPQNPSDPLNNPQLLITLAFVLAFCLGYGLIIYAIIAFHLRGDWKKFTDELALKAFIFGVLTFAIVPQMVFPASLPTMQTFSFAGGHIMQQAFFVALLLGGAIIHYYIIFRPHNILLFLYILSFALVFMAGQTPINAMAFSQIIAPEIARNFLVASMANMIIFVGLLLVIMRALCNKSR